jgi:hypothetical protein
MPEQLEPKDAAHEIAYLWEWFCQLSNSRSYAEFGALPITYAEIKAWAELTHSEPTAWDVNVIKQIDSVFIAEANKK